MLNREDELDRALRENELLAAENERLSGELREATAKYAEIRASLSWRVTAPVRALVDRFTRPARNVTGPMLLNQENYLRWIERFDKLTDADRSAIRAAIKRLKQQPLFSLLIVVSESPADALHRTIQSIRRQLYREWEICLVDDASTAPHVARALASCGDDPRVRVNRRAASSGFTAAADDALAMSSGEFIAFLDPGDSLPENALFEIAAELDVHPDADIVYSDEDELDAQGQRCHPRFKTAWNPDLFEVHDYLGRLTVRRRESARTRACELPPSRIRHIPSILCHSAEKEPVIPVQTASRELVSPPPAVSVIIPTRDRADLLERCVEGLLNRTDYPALEIIVLDNDSREERTRQLFDRYPVRVLPQPGAFNWAAMNNAGARAATGEILLFLNNDTDVIEQGWLRALAAYAIRPEIGAVGAKLLFADGTVQHAGIWLGPDARVRHLLRLSNRNDPGYLGQLSLTRNLSAVTGACLAIRRNLFLEVGGFDESFPVSYNDIDLCLRLIQRGYRIVWTPHSELLHLESASRGSSEWRWRKEEADFRRFRTRWDQQLEHDPFFNPNLDLIGEEKLALAFPPRIKKPWRL